MGFGDVRVVARFEKGDGEEDARVADLPHHVQQSIMHAAPVVRAEGLAFEHEAHGRWKLEVFLGTDAAPKGCSGMVS